jgi:hypothetical protein
MLRITNIAAAQPTKQPMAEPICQSSARPITKAATLPTNMKKIDDIKHIANIKYYLVGCDGPWLAYLLTAPHNRNLSRLLGSFATPFHIRNHRAVQ